MRKNLNHFGKLSTGNINNNIHYCIIDLIENEHKIGSLSKTNIICYIANKIFERLYLNIIWKNPIWSHFIENYFKYINSIHYKEK